MSRSLCRVLIGVALVLPGTATAQTFVPLGPSPSTGPIPVVQSGDAAPNGTVAGAVQAILLDPALGANTMFIGATNGGVWKTTNGGTTWTPLTDRASSLSIASLGLDPSDTSGNTLIAGVGLTSNGIWDFFNRANREGAGADRTGLLYSTNGGNTWTSIGGAQLGGQSVIGVAAVGQTILAATFEPQAAGVTTTAGGASYGLYRSVTGGSSFSLISGAPGSGLPAGAVTSLVADPRNTGSCGVLNSCTFYASITSPSNPQAAGAYISNNSGQTWSPIFTNTTSVSGGSNYIASASDQLVIKVATGPNGSVAIAIANNPSSGDQRLQALYMSQNNGGSWSALAVPVVSAGVHQAVVNLAIAIDPSNTSILYVAGDGLPTSPFTIPAFRVQGNVATSLTDGNTSNNSTAHSDARALVINAAGNLLMGSDGGIYMRSSPQSSAGAWTGLNSSTLQIREANTIAFGANAKRMIVAAQDTGIAIQSAPGSVLYNAIQGADGVNAVVSDKTFANQSVYYNSYYNYGELSRLILDSQGNRVSPGTAATGVPITCNGGNDCASEVTNQYFSSPFILNKVDPKQVALAGGHVYVSTDNAPANATSVDLTLVDLGATGGAVSALAYGTIDNPNVVLAGNNHAIGQATGSLYLSTTAAAGSIARLTAYRGDIPTALVFDQRSQNRFYVVDSFNLWGTQNQGSTIQNLTTQLPTNITRPTSVEFINNNGVNALVVGGLSNTPTAQSQITVADSDTSGNLSGWRLFGTGLPNVLVSQMSYNPIVDLLAVAAVGRGVWTLYDVTSYFPQATVLQFGLADNDSVPDASFLTNGTSTSRSLIKYGTGTLTIAGNATYTGGTVINNGALVLGNGGPSGGSILGNVVFCSNAGDPTCNTSSGGKALAFNRSDTYTFAGSITGPGQVMQMGIGTTILTGSSTYSGPTFVENGTLLVHGSITSPVTVDAGGTLGGNGHVGNVTVNAGGVYSPGASVGTHTVHGNLTFNPGSAYFAEIQGNTADRIRVLGAATLGGTLAVPFLGGSLNNHYTILTAEGGRTGTFDTLIPFNAPAFITTNVAYTSDAVLLNLTSGLGRIAGLTGNQAVVAAALDNAFNNGGGSLPGLGNVPAGQLPSALDTISGDGTAGTQQTAFGASSTFMSIMMDQGTFWRSGATVDVNGVTFDETMSYASSAKANTSEHPAFKSVLKAPPTSQPRWRAWLTGFDGTWKLDGGGGLAGLNSNTGGLAGGFDYQFAPDVLLGFSLGGSSSNFSVRDRITGGHLDAAHFGGYGVKTWSSFYIAGALGFSTFRNDTSRTITGAGPGEMAAGHFGSNLLSGRLEVGSKQTFARFAVTPFAAVQVAKLWQNGYTETAVPQPGGETLALSYAATATTSLPTFLGAQVDSRVLLPNGITMLPYTRLSWVHEFSPTRQVSPTFVALPGTLFTVDGPRAARDAAKIELGTKFAVNKAKAFVGFDGEFSNRSQAYAGKAGFNLTW